MNDEELKKIVEQKAEQDLKKSLDDMNNTTKRIEKKLKEMQEKTRNE